MTFRAPLRRAFVLLEVMVAIAIIGIAVTSILRGFIITLESMKRLRLNEQAIVLGRTLMDDLILEPPDEGTYRGRFSDDARFGAEMADWSWEIRVEAEEPDYDERPKGTIMQDLEQVYSAVIEVKHQPRDDEPAETVLTMQTILLDPDLYSVEALQGNQLF